ncbi:hypothetical protein A3J34_04880 [Candidatus Peribacteria bacterium RIFCSPLOWO2_02_FULL_51_10]|nr:MAG: hypothetical protein A3J34_04880 [Candidatus Peribacteria bacterium RIFCSPLOWO2_02_FULL_51_10]
MKRFAQFVVFLVVLTFTLTPVFADVKVVPKPDKVKAVRAAEVEALDKVFTPWLEFNKGVKKAPAEYKATFAKMIADWEKLVQSGNYTALVRYAEYRDRYAKDESDHSQAVRLWKSAVSCAATAEEKHEAEEGLWSANLRYVVKILRFKDEPAKK